MLNYIQLEEHIGHYTEMYTIMIPMDVEHQTLTNNIFQRNGKIVFFWI